MNLLRNGQKLLMKLEVREYGNWGGRVDDNGVTPANNNSENSKEGILALGYGIAQRLSQKVTLLNAINIL